MMMKKSTPAANPDDTSRDLQVGSAPAWRVCATAFVRQVTSKKP